MNTYTFLHWIFPIFESAQHTINSSTWNNWIDYMQLLYLYLPHFIKWRKTEWLTCFKKIARETFFAIFLGTVTHNCANSLDETASFFSSSIYFPRDEFSFQFVNFYILHWLVFRFINFKNEIEGEKIQILVRLQDWGTVFRSCGFYFFMFRTVQER